MSDRQPLSIRNILLFTIGALSLLVAVSTLQQVVQEWLRLDRIQTLKSAMLDGDQLFDMAEKLSLERDLAFLMLHSPTQTMSEGLTEDLKDNRAAVDATLPVLLTSFGKYELPGMDARIKRTWVRLTRLQELRKQVDAQAELPPGKRDAKVSEEWFDETTTLISDVRNLWMDFTAHFNDIDPTVTLQIRLKFFLGTITEYAGQQRAMISRLIVENASPTGRQQADLLRWQGMLDLCWRVSDQLASSARLSSAIDPALKDAQSHYSNLHDMVGGIFFMPGTAAKPPYPIGADTWMELASEASDSLYALKDAALAGTQRYVTSLETAAEHAIALWMGVLVASLVLCFYSFRIVTRRVLMPIHNMVEALIDTTEGRNVVPMPVAAGRQDEIGKLARVLQSFQQTMAEIRRSNRDLERSNKELDDFAYIASHDLKEPLRGIHNHSRFLLEDNEGKLDKESVDRIGRLIYLSQRIEKLVNDLLYFSRLGRQELAVVPTDMNIVIQDIRRTMAEFIEQNHATILLPKPLPTVVCDKLRVTEVFRNLIVNALKYNHRKEKTVEIGFLDTAVAPGGKNMRNVFYVKDNGYGIPKEFHEEIFRIFRRLEATRRAAEDSTGVGLTFVKKIVERHGGRVWLESAQDEGSTFYFTLQEAEERQNDRQAA